MKRFLLIAFIIASIVSQSQNSSKKLLYFSGSDWCIPCMEFNASVIENKLFKDFCAQDVNLEQVDFPQKTKGISKNELARRDSLANLYNREGKFPLLVLIDVDGPKQVVIPHYKRSVASIIENIKTHIEKNNKRDEKILMGSLFTIKLCGNDSVFLKTSWELLTKLETDISSWNDSSEISLINRNAGVKEVKISKSVYELLKLSKSLSSLTQGSFDVTIGPALKIWNWKKAIVPNKFQIDSVRSLVNHELLVLNDSAQTAFLKLKGMRIDLGAIGKGYACEKVVEFWKEKGIQSGAISAGGDIYVLGDHCYGKSWGVSIRDPQKNNEIIYSLKESNISVATSGDYERYFEVDGKKYSHILNPLTCRPASEVTSVTVFSEKAILADALATSLSVMAPENSLHLVNQLEGIEAIIIEHNGEVHFSKGIQNE